MNPNFCIATLALPSGAQIGIAPLPGKAGALSSDIEAIKAWDAEYVLSMTPLAEMVAAGTDGLEQALLQAGIRWEHFPIEDFGIPDQQTDAEWGQISTALQRILDDGRNVLLHCMGGKGRSGMIALRLLIERGENPDEALVRIRSVRPGAVETEAQRLWAVDGGRVRLVDRQR